ncbi:hypothetical protein Mapa_011071 [Marchantia paleacea]|nr:hypothetical protein Mapa_011071 [Marchantia paleacea]
MASTMATAFAGPLISNAVGVCDTRTDTLSRRHSRNLCSSSGNGSLRSTFFGKDCGPLRNSGVVKPWKLSIHSPRRERAAARCHAVRGMETTEASHSVDETDSLHQFVIVGAGIAGLATAAAMNKIGVKSLVLEQSAELRTTGASLTLWSNAWRVLDVLGIGDELRSKHQPMSGIRFFNQEEKLLKTFDLEECPGGPHELCSVERKLLANALASQLPRDTIRLNSRVHSIERESNTGPFVLNLSDGCVLRTRVLLGADGVNSVVAQWMGLAKTRYVGQVGIRGVAVYPAGQPYGDKVRQFLGRGVRAGLAPISSTKVYWFMVYNRSSPGNKVTDPAEVRAELLSMLDGWPQHMRELLDNTPLDYISRAALADRWNLPGITAPVVQSGVTLAGDALHPMTPNLGQGGCCALEDAIKLAQTLGVVLAKGGNADYEAITKAMEEYAAERHHRTFPLTLKSFVFGALLQIGFAPVCFVRDNIAVPKIVRPSSFLSHTRYNCGELPPALVVRD